MESAHITGHSDVANAIIEIIGIFYTSLVCFFVRSVNFLFRGRTFTSARVAPKIY